MSAVTPSQPDAEYADWTQVPEGCRVLVVQLMDSATRAAWSRACRLTFTDVHTSTRSLVWAGKLTLGSYPDQTPRTLPAHLIASLANLQHLNCRGMACLVDIHGIPPTLRSLDLTGCHSLGSMAALQHCTALERLLLTGNRKEWNELALTLPEAMSAVGPHLRHLSLRVLCWSSDEAACALVRALEPLTCLQELTFGMHARQVEHWEAFASVLGRLTHLRLLDLSRNHCEDAIAAALAPTIKQLTQLRSLDISGNTFDTGGTAELTDAIASLPASLTRLDIGDAAVHNGVNAASMAAALEAHAATLKVIRLAGASLGPGRIATLAPCLHNCPGLTELSLGHSFVNESGEAVALALSGSAAPHLTYLDISSPYLRDEDAQALAPALSSLSSLAYLDCSGHWQGPVGTAALIGALSTIAPSLTSLNISRATLGDHGAAALAPALRCMTSLTRLLCTHNRLGLAGAQALATALPAMPRLRHLSLNNNPWEVEGLRALVGGLQALPRQQHWILHCCCGYHVGGALCRRASAKGLASLLKGLSCVDSWEVRTQPCWRSSLADGVEVLVLEVSL